MGSPLHRMPGAPRSRRDLSRNHKGALARDHESSQANLECSPFAVAGLRLSAPVYLVSSSDDYILEMAVGEAVRKVCDDLGGIEPETVPDESSPEDLAVELCSPSLFAPQRVLVAPETGGWLQGPGRKKGKKAEVDVSPLVRVLEEGVADGIALVMGACCSGKPKGALVDAVDEAGTFIWHPVPEAPKPWEDAILSNEQEAMLLDFLKRIAGEVRFTADASRMLLDRLGFAPRLLTQEVRKLVAANVDGVVDEELVLALSFPKERSLDVVGDAVFERRAAPVLDILAALEAGIQVRDRQGRAVTAQGAPFIVFGQVSSIVQQLFYLRRLAAKHGLVDELTPERTRDRYWYPRKFKNGLGPKFLDFIKDDAPSPVFRGSGRPPSLFFLGKQVKGAAQYTDQDLMHAIADLGAVETAVRGEMPTESLTVWLMSFLR